VPLYLVGDIIDGWQLLPQPVLGAAEVMFRH
jgi:hypothetical protein